MTYPTQDTNLGPPRMPITQRRGTIKAGFIWRIVRLLTSPAAALITVFPTIGFYTMLMVASIWFPESSLPAVLIRGGSLMVLFLAFYFARKNRRFPMISLLPASLFLILYTSRILENMFLSNLIFPPDNRTALLVYFLSCLLPAYLLVSIPRDIRDIDFTTLMSVFAILYVVGLYFNWDALSETSEFRATLERINPVALAYLASSFLLFYFLNFGRSKRLMVEALVTFPLLLVVVAITRSRGMLVASGLSLFIYFLVSRGRYRLHVLIGAIFVALIGYHYSDSDYTNYLIDTINRIDIFSDEERIALYNGSFDQIYDYPLFGRYILELKSNFYPHNIYLEAVMAVGIIGAIPFFIHTAIASTAAIRLIRNKRNSVTGAFIALLFFRDAIGAAAAGSLWGNAGFWISSFMVIALQNVQARSRRRRPGPINLSRLTQAVRS